VQLGRCAFELDTVSQKTWCGSASQGGCAA
jgi:hypothetical protein